MHENNKDNAGLSLRATFIAMFIVTIAIAVVLLGITYRALKSFRALSDATESYIVLEDAAEELLSGSDYLTEEAQCFTVMGDMKHLYNYINEAETVRRREKSVETIEKILPDSPALSEIKNAMSESVALMEKEYYAMMLVLSTHEDAIIPDSMKNIELSSEDAALPAGEKLLLSARLLHDEDYYNHKSIIRDHLSQCIEELKSVTYSTQDRMEERMHVDLVWLIVMVALQTAFVLVMLWLMTTLGINPIIRAVEHIKQDQSLPIVGANEFRYLASTYNIMYAAYKRSIENLSFKASHDELTGAYNRAGYDLIKTSFDLSTSAILLFDAEKFKNINDTYGHEMGDRVLKKIAAVLKQNFRSDDYVCRIGGDEFVVMMVHIDQSVRHLIENKITKINSDLENSSDGIPAISLSAGVSMCHRNNDSQEMFHEADVALYHVKDNGRRGVCFYEPGMRQRQLKS